VEYIKNMGQSSRISQAQRFLDAFKREYDKKIVLSTGPWEIESQGNTTLMVSE